MKPNVTKFIRNIQSGLSKHSPAILTGVGIAGMITTTVLAVKATPKAIRLIEQAKEENQTEELTAVETVKAAWKPYIPAAVTCGMSVACLIGASSVHARRNAALATAYKLSETALSEFKNAVVETVDEEKVREIREKVNKKALEKNPESKSTVIVTGDGDSLIYDAHSGRYFESSINKIKEAVVYLNGRMVDGMEMYITLNEFYDEIGLGRTVIGEDLGWCVDERIEVGFDSQLTDKGKPCIVMEYLQPPAYGFKDLY